MNGLRTQPSPSRWSYHELVTMTVQATRDLASLTMLGADGVCVIEFCEISDARVDVPVTRTDARQRLEPPREVRYCAPTRQWPQRRAAASVNCFSHY